MDLFSPLGNVYVSFLTDTTAFVSLSDRDNSSKVMSSLNWGGRVSIMTYAQFKSLEEELKHDDLRNWSGKSLKQRNSSSSCGLTPMLENANISFSSGFSSGLGTPSSAAGGDGRAATTAATPRQQLAGGTPIVHQKRRLNSPASAPFKRQKSVAEGAIAEVGEGGDVDDTQAGKDATELEGAIPIAVSQEKVKEDSSKKKLYDEPNWE